MPDAVSKKELADIVTEKWRTDDFERYQTVGFSSRETEECPKCNEEDAIYGCEMVAAERSPFYFKWEHKAACEVEYLYCRTCRFRIVEIDDDKVIEDKSLHEDVN